MNGPGVPAALQTEEADYLVNKLRSSLLEGREGGREGARKKGGRNEILLLLLVASS